MAIERDTELYLALRSVWLAERKPRRFTYGGQDYMSLDSGERFAVIGAGITMDTGYGSTVGQVKPAGATNAEGQAVQAEPRRSPDNRTKSKGKQS